MEISSKDTFTILHLSDLHIVKHRDDDYSTALHRMIDHIDHVTKKSKNIIVVFTGDLVEKGKFNESKKIIIKFFKDLHDKLKEKIIDIVFTPGNHDKKRGVLVMQPVINEGDEKFWEKFKKDDWEYFENQFEDYKETIGMIEKEIFNQEPQFSNSYGLKTVEVNGYKLCFLCINSAWACIGNDEGNLRIGRFQLDDLMSQYQKEKEGTDLVIALMHHPTDWLTKAEQKYLNQYMTDTYRLNTNIMLQGHIHEKETYNWYNQNHSLTTLVTGMGWDKQKETEDSGHRYSVYEINMKSLIVRVNTYVTDKGGLFVDDTALYNGNNIIFPLFVHRYLELNQLKFEKSEISLFYPDYNPAENLKKIINGLNEFNILIMEKLKEYEFDWLCYSEIKTQIIREMYDLSKEEKSEMPITKQKIMHRCLNNVVIKYIKKIRGQNYIKNNLANIDRFFQYREVNNKKAEEKGITIDNFFAKDLRIHMKDFFYSFIGEFCICLLNKIFCKKDFEKGDVVRIHFRIISRRSQEVVYKKLFAYTAIMDAENEKLKYISDEKGGTNLTDISYEDSMIEKSFKENKALLFSLNPLSNKHKSKAGWIDFITIAPNIDCNKCKVDAEYDEQSMPYISFGISVNSIHFQNTIRGLAYAEFEKVLSRFMKKFFECISFDINVLFREEDDCN